MLLEFKLSNYKSYKDEAIFSMVAESARLKSSNLHEFNNIIDQSFRVSKASIIYGPNASGKSNLIKALNDVIEFIINKPVIGQDIKLYKPFYFDSNKVNQPISFELTFLGPNKIRYIYKFSITGDIVIEETLEYYPEKKKRVIFSRTNKNIPNEVIDRKLDDIEKVKLDKREYTIFKNQLFLSKFAEEPHKILTDVYLYFKEKYSINVSNSATLQMHSRVSESLLKNPDLEKQVAALLKVADTKINGISIEEIDENSINHLSPSLKEVVLRNPYVVMTYHDIYDGDELMGLKVPFPFQNESRGSKTLFTLGTKILDAINTGKVLIVDELDTSLHPYVTRLLVMLFLSNKRNDKGAQLIFSTHDISLLDKDLFRRDQIWFTEKDKKGATEIYSLQDFEGLREDIPFEKWYMAGKFGALPSIEHIDSIFE